MRPTAVFVLVAVLSLGLVAATAKTVNATQNDSDRVTSTMAGPDKGLTTASDDAAKDKAADTSGAQPSKEALKKSRIAQKPKLQDPN